MQGKGITKEFYLSYLTLQNSIIFIPSMYHKFFFFCKYCISILGTLYTNIYSIQNHSCIHVYGLIFTNKSFLFQHVLPNNNLKTEYTSLNHPCHRIDIMFSNVYVNNELNNAQK